MDRKILKCIFFSFKDDDTIGSKRNSILLCKLPLKLPFSSPQNLCMIYAIWHAQEIRKGSFHNSGSHELPADLDVSYFTLGLNISF